MNIRINILTPFPNITFTRQKPRAIEKEGFYFFENGSLEESWDMVVVYEGIKDLKKIKCKQGGLVFISGEPPFSQRYSKMFLNQFDHLITSHPKIRHANNHLSQQALPWHFGLNFQTKEFNYDFEDILKMPVPSKKKVVSFITSNKLMMPGHKKRMIFLKALKYQFGDAIDIFGKGINPIQDKASALLPYQFSICIENSTIDNYWTEKISDPLLAYCIPIYHGCKNIDKYFNTDALVRIDISDIKMSIAIIENILLNADMIYSQKLIQLKMERNRLIEDYNIYSVLKLFFIENIKNEFKLERVIRLKPSEYFWDYQIKINVLRLKRYLYRYL